MEVVTSGLWQTAQRRKLLYVCVAWVAAVAIVFGPLAWSNAESASPPGQSQAAPAKSDGPKSDAAKSNSGSSGPAKSQAPKAEAPKQQIQPVTAANSAPKPADPPAQPKSADSQPKRTDAQPKPADTSAQHKPTSAPAKAATSASTTAAATTAGGVKTSSSAAATQPVVAPTQSIQKSAPVADASASSGATSGTTAAARVTTAESPTPKTVTSPSPAAEASPAPSASPTSGAATKAGASPEVAASPSPKAAASPSPSPVASASVASAPAIATPESAVNAASGAAAAQAGEAGTATQNTQLGIAAVAGGDGPVLVQNQHTSSVVDSSAATAASGVTVALAPTAPAKPASGVTTARSGNAAASGVAAANTVSNTSVAVAEVGQGSSAPVNLISNNNVAVTDTGNSAATSGAAWAVAPGATGAPSGVATPGASTSAASQPASATGLKAQNTLNAATQSQVNVVGGPNSAAPIVVAPTPQIARVVAGGVAEAVSGAACEATCGAAGAAAGQANQATSGAAEAHGLTAQNTVNTTARATIDIGGQNFAPIKVILDSITQIFNWGAGSARSGDATATGGTAGASRTGATSASAMASGAEVTNTINMRSAAAVHVQGDNYNPINIILNLAANLANWGVGVANTGDVRSGAGGGAATSGQASATGLQVVNVVNMWADASVDITGNNYAPIVIEIRFKTDIDNRGYASATSGNVAAGSSSPAGGGGGTAAGGAVGAGGATAAGASGATTRARGGNAVAIGGSVNSNVVSNQVANTGSGAITSTAMQQMLRSLPTGNWAPFVENNLPTQAPAPGVQPGIVSTSGDTMAAGLHSATSQTNAQVAVCSDTNGKCKAANEATLNVVARDSARNAAALDANDNPGLGGTTAISGFAGVNATPTAAPSQEAASRGTGSAGGGRKRARAEFASQSIATQIVAQGHVVLVDLWDQWPGRRLPPMPNMGPGHDPNSSTTDVTIAGWPGTDELPLPDLTNQQTSQPTARATGARLTRPAGGAGHALDSAAEPDAETYPPLEIQTVDPFNLWPAASMAPMPPQVLPAAPAVDQPAVEEVSPSIAEPTSTPPTDADGGLQTALAAMAAIALGAAGGAARYRGLFAQAGAWASQLRTTLRRLPSSWAGRQRARGLALLRLTLGMLRMW